MIAIDYNTKEITGELWQYDYGETLRIQGGNLQKAQEVHFSLNGTGGTTVTRIGNKRRSDGRSNSRLHARK